MNQIKQLLSDGSGSLSTMRVGVLLVLIAVLGNWVYLTVHTGQAQPLDWQQVSMVIGAFAAKATQSAFEPPSAPVPVAPPAK